RISPTAALVFGAALILLGTLVLVWKVNLLTGFLGLLSAFLYVLVYTPLKRVSWINTLVGGIPGALPPMGGWAAASGELSLGAWVLFLILFVWQQPHFYAIAWLYREDYARGGLKMLPVVDPNGVSTLREILVYLALLIPLSLMPCVIGLAGKFYYVGAIVLGIYYLIPGIRLAQTRSMTDARRLLKASVLYLPLLLALIIFDASF
ncbi:MAG: protoheme IX farnesyltransferase, partial [Bdellovibrionales bacterium]|nr:protoheme IX farnesyltransferase [Bdellovibrionales bacterium]